VTALPDWMDLPDGMSAEDYEALPEETCRRIEIVAGAVIVNAAPPPAPGRLPPPCSALEAASGPAVTASTDVDLLLRDIPLLAAAPMSCCTTRPFPMARCSGRGTAPWWSRSCHPGRWPPARPASRPGTIQHQRRSPI